jgi:hypothetical protein
MKGQSLGLSIVGIIALGCAMAATYADDEVCDGVLVQSRFALSNCMIESATAIAASVATQNGCQAGEWNIQAVVPELVYATIPIQGYVVVSNGEDYYVLNGQSSAMLKNSVNCQVATTADVNTFAGEVFTYSSGSGNFYVDAIIDKDESLLCISESLSAGNVTLAGPPIVQLEERDSLSFEAEDDSISAGGMLSILGRSGRGRTTETLPLSAWTMEEEVTLPALNTSLDDAFELEATTTDIGSVGCKIEVEGAVENLEFWTVEGTSGGLTITGTLSIETVDDD